MATFVNDTFTEASDTTLASHTGETGATWAKHPSYSGSITVIGSTDRIRQASQSGGNAVYYASGTPANADYDVQVDFYVASNADFAMVCGRMSTSADTYYYIIYYQPDGQFKLGKVVSGTGTDLATYTQALTVGQSYTVKLSMSGTSLTGSIGGVQRLSATDSAISAAGKAGVRIFSSSSSGDSSTGYHLDNFSATDASGGGGSNPIIRVRLEGGMKNLTGGMQG